MRVGGTGLEAWPTIDVLAKHVEESLEHHDTLHGDGLHQEDIELNLEV